MRLVVARCEVRYTGRLNAVAAGVDAAADAQGRTAPVLVHADAGGYKPLNWMTPPTVVEDGGRACSSSASAPARPRTGSRSGSLEVLSDVAHEMGEAAALEKDGVERDLQELLADAARTRSATGSGSSGASGRPTSAPST